MTSRVGILSSTQCQNVLHRYLDDEICLCLRLLVRTSSLLVLPTDNPHILYSRECLNNIRSSVGYRLLSAPETAWKIPSLACASQEKLMGLFLILIGAIISVGYTSRLDSRHSKLSFEERRHGLLCILTHHMVYIGDKLGLLDCDTTNRRLTETCDALWNKIGYFFWSMDNLECCDACSADTLGLTQAPSEDSIADDATLQDLQGGLFSEFTPNSTMPSYTACFVCGDELPSDDLCQNCFGTWSNLKDASLTTFQDSRSPIVPVTKDQSSSTATTLKSGPEWVVPLYCESFPCPTWTEYPKAAEERSTSPSKPEVTRPTAQNFHHECANGFEDRVPYRDSSNLNMCVCQHMHCQNCNDLLPSQWGCCICQSLNPLTAPTCTNQSQWGLL